MHSSQIWVDFKINQSRPATEWFNRQLYPCVFIIVISCIFRRVVLLTSQLYSVHMSTATCLRVLFVAWDHFIALYLEIITRARDKSETHLMAFKDRPLTDRQDQDRTSSCHYCCRQAAGHNEYVFADAMRNHKAHELKNELKNDR